MTTTERVLDLAREAGFDLAGVAPFGAPPDAGRFEEWLGAGHHAGMEYLERNRDRIVDPARTFPGGRSLLVLGLGHSRPAGGLSDGARVARYAAGRDYHNVIGRMLRKLSRRLREEGLVGAQRAIVDAGPLLERSHARAAGLGFASKATNLLHPRFGPWFFLAELLLEEELEPTRTPPAGSCGTCTACLDACPTAAFTSPGVLDATRCISYHTIENRGAIPRALRASFGDWIFGCDVCSEVCPWGHDAPDLAERFGLHAAVAEGSAVRWLELEPEAFGEHFRGSPLKRPRREGLARNAAIVLGNRPTRAGREVLLRALSFDPSPPGARGGGLGGGPRGAGRELGRRAGAGAGGAGAGGPQRPRPGGSGRPRPQPGRRAGRAHPRPRRPLRHGGAAPRHPHGAPRGGRTAFRNLNVPGRASIW